MLSAVRFIANKLIASAVGRWTLTIILLLIGIISLLAYPTVTQTESVTDGNTALVTGVVFTILGILMLVATIRIGRAQRLRKRARDAELKRANELAASGVVLPIPALPPLPKGIPADAVAEVEGYAERMAKLPWGDDLQTSAADASDVFNRTVARIRSVRGDLGLLKEPINTCVGLPQPWSYVGAAEIMLQLAYYGGTASVPVGLRQGLRFIARSQFTEPIQPDALVIRTKLLAASPSKTWLELADQTLARLRQAAPDHPRQPDAAAEIHLRRGEDEAAIACYDQTIAQPPSAEEAFIARTLRAAALERLQRHDEALAGYQDALRIDPNDAWAWHNASIILLDQGRLDEALAANTRALANMDFSNAHVIRARILAALAARAGAPAATPPPESPPASA